MFCGNCKRRIEGLELNAVSSWPMHFHMLSHASAKFPFLAVLALELLDVDLFDSSVV